MMWYIAHIRPRDLKRNPLDTFLRLENDYHSAPFATPFNVATLFNKRSFLFLILHAYGSDFECIRHKERTYA